MAPLAGLFRRDVRLGLRQGGDIGLVLGFFVLAVLLFPFGVGPEPELLGRIGAGIIWVAALLASVLSLDRLFAADHLDGIGAVQQGDAIAVQGRSGKNAELESFGDVVRLGNRRIDGERQ